MLTSPKEDQKKRAQYFTYRSAELVQRAEPSWVWAAIVASVASIPSFS